MLNYFICLVIQMHRSNWVVVVLLERRKATLCEFFESYSVSCSVCVLVLSTQAM